MGQCNTSKNAPPEEIIHMLPMQKEVSILDVGAGSGYLTIPAAKQTVGTVFALDIDERMLQVIDVKAKAVNISNIQLVEGISKTIRYSIAPWILQ